MRLFQKLHEDGSVAELVRTSADDHGEDYAQRLLAQGYVEVVEDDSKPVLTVLPDPQPEAGEPAPAAAEAPVTNEAPEVPKAVKVKPAPEPNRDAEAIAGAALLELDSTDETVLAAALSEVQAALNLIPGDPTLLDAEQKLQARQAELAKAPE